MDDQAQLEHQDYKVKPELTVKPEHQDNKVRKDNQEKLDNQEMPEHQVNKEKRAQPVHKVFNNILIYWTKIYENSVKLNFFYIFLCKSIYYLKLNS
jgi:hypothetical protein